MSGKKRRTPTSAERASSPETREELRRAHCEFLGNVRHQIRTPMNALIGLSYLLLDTDLDEQQRDYVSKIYDSARSLLSAIDGLCAEQVQVEDRQVSSDSIDTSLCELISSAKSAQHFEKPPQFCTGLRVLLVEDDPINQLVTKAMLTKAGVDIDICSSGFSALDHVRHHRYDIILMDVHMPGMDGYETTRHLRTLSNGQSVPIIALTASALDSDRDKCISAQMNDHMAKPFQLPVLLRVLAQWTGRLVPTADSIQTLPDASVASKDAPHGGVDAEAAMRPLKPLGDERELFLDLASTFVEHFQPLSEHFLRLNDESVCDSLVLEAHTLGTDASILGAGRLQQLAREYEQMLRNSADREEISPVAEKLTDELHLVLSELKYFIASATDKPA